MTIFVEDKLKPGQVGVQLADAVDIETTGASNVQSDLDTANNDITIIENTLRQSNGAGIAWRFNSELIPDPPQNSFRFNNADPEQATEIYVDVFSVSGRFDEFLVQFATGGFVYLQDRTNTRNNFLYETSGSITLTGGTDGYYTIPVTFRRSQSVLSAATNDIFTFIFLPVGTTQTGTGTLPNMFLNEITEVDTTVYTNQVDTESSFVRMWLRASLVTAGGEGNPGTGLVITEANGDLPFDGVEYQRASNGFAEYLYLTLPDAFVSGNDLSTVDILFIEDDGGENQRTNLVLNLQSNFVIEAGLTAAGTVFRSDSGGRLGTFPGYRINETIKLFFRATDTDFTISEANAENVDLTRAVKSLTESQLVPELRAKVNASNGFSQDDQFKLDQFVEVSTTTADGALTGNTSLYWRDTFSEDFTDYYVTDFDTGIPPNFGLNNTVVVAVSHEFVLTSFAGSESGIGTLSLLFDGQLLTGSTNRFNIYTLTLPVTTSATNFFKPNGTETTITELDPTSIVKIDRTNVQADFLTHIENSQSSSVDEERLTALENKVSVLYALAPDIDALTNWGDIYVPERPVQEVVLTDGYDLIADFRGPSTRYESAGVTYDDTGVDIVEYTGLSESLRRVFGFRVTAPADLTLLSVIDGAEIIPLIDVTVAGNYRVNNYTPAQTSTVDVTNQTTFLSAVDDDNLISTASNDNARFSIPDYPAGATNTSRSVSVDFEVLVNGVDTGAGHFVSIDVPETSVEQDRIQITFTANLGPLHSNRQVTATVDYRFVTTPDFRLIFTMVSGPSDVTLRVSDVALVRSYTAGTTIARVDNFQILTDLMGNYTFTGENELLIAFHPYPATNTMNVVPVVVNSLGVIDELNDQLTPVPHAGFEDVRIPDTIQFRTFRADHILNHSDLATLIADRNIQWAYGLARLRTVSTTHAVTESIDLASGSSVNGQVISSGRTVQKAQTFTAASTVSVSLPASTTLGDFVLMEVTWHTGVGTATDNNNRNYTELGFIDALIEATDNEVILGGRGRGAENYGIEVDTSTINASDTSIDIGIINLNDLGGATLPAGSLITDVRFY